MGLKKEEDKFRRIGVVLLVMFKLVLSTLSDKQVKKDYKTPYLVER